MLGIAAIFLFTLVVMLLWNALIPALFKGPVVTYWQTLGLLVLSKILFSGIGGGAHGDKSRPFRSHRVREDYPKSRWRQRYEEKMNDISEGEKKEKEQGAAGDQG